MLSATANPVNGTQFPFVHSTVHNTPKAAIRGCATSLLHRHSGHSKPFVFHGPINRPAFEPHVEKVRVPKLGPSDIIIMASPSSHKRKGVRESTEVSGAEFFFLSPYSHSRNLIEMAFSKLNVDSHKIVERTVEEHFLHHRDLLARILKLLCRRIRSNPKGQHPSKRAR